MKNKIFFFCYIIVILFQINIAKVYAEESSVYQINGSIFKYNEDNNIIEVVGNVVATDKMEKKFQQTKLFMIKKIQLSKHISTLYFKIQMVIKLLQKILFTTF